MTSNQIVRRRPRREVFFQPHFALMNSEPVYGAVEASRYLELKIEHHQGLLLRAFTIRINTKMPEGSVTSLFEQAARHDWFGFWSNPETNEYDVLTFVNKAAP